jgi:hypothetical protein
MTKKKKPEVIFDPGCFDELDMTQEELDGFVAMIQKMAEDGSLEANSRQLTDEDIAEMDEETRNKLLGALENVDTPRKLQ